MHPTVINSKEERMALIPSTVKGLSLVERNWSPSLDVQHYKNFMKAAEEGKIVLGTALLTNIAREKMPVSACTVIPIDLAKGYSSIKNSIFPFLLTGMGTGFNLDDLDNPIETLKSLNTILTEADALITRRVAGLASLRVNHPQIIEFINSKRNENFSDWKFNISVCLTEEFMKSVESNSNISLIIDKHITDTVSARAILGQIIDSMHYCGEPGIIFADRFERDNPIPQIKYDGYSPCAELGLAKGDYSHFSYINLPKFIEKNRMDIDYESLISATRLLTRMLDNAVEISINNPVGDSSLLAGKRRISLGICGAADLLFQLRLPYASIEAVTLLEDIMSIINYYSKSESVELARQRGRFPLFDESRYKVYDWATRFKLSPTPHVTEDMWKNLWLDMCKYGIRNASTTALSPFGDWKMIGASCSLEPAFSLVNSTGEIHNEFETAITDFLKISNSNEIEKILSEVYRTGKCSRIVQIPTELKNIFAVAEEIDYKDHLRMMKALQNHVDEAIAKTINLSNNSTKKDIEDIIYASYREGIKGITIFRNGCLSERQASK